MEKDKIHADEISTGDYLLNDKQEVCRVWVISDIGQQYFQVDNKSKNDGCFELLFIEDASGIPITKELLEKNDFEENANGDMVFDGENYKVIWCAEGNKGNTLINNIYTCSEVDVWCNYLHELQRVFKVCGVDKILVP